MSSERPSGWYPDPSGDSKQFRWWDGAQWTDAVTETLWAPAPRDPRPYVDRTPGRHAAAPTADWTAEPLELDDDTGGRRRRLTVLVGATAALIVLAAAGILLWQKPNLTDSNAKGAPSAGAPTSAAPPNPEPSRTPSRTPDGTPTPTRSAGPGASTTPGGSRSPAGPVRGGHLVFRSPGNGWTSASDVFRRDLPNSRAMTKVTESEFDGKRNWAATFACGDLPKDLASKADLDDQTRAVAAWFLKTEWGSPPDEPPTGGRATTVDGRRAFRVRTQVSYDIEGLRSKRADIDVVLIDYGPRRPRGAVIAIVPDTHSHLWTQVDDVIASIHWVPT